MRTHLPFRPVAFGALATLLVSIGSVNAAPQKERTNDPASPDPLSGPSVQDRKVPEGRKRAGDHADNAGPGRRGPGAAHREFMEAVRALASEPTPEPERLTEEQQESIRAVEQEFRDAMRTFQAEHKDELEALRREAGLPTGPREADAPPADRGPARNIEEGRGRDRARRAGGDGAAPGNRRDRPAAGDDGEGRRPDGADRSASDPEARKRLAELMKTGPKPEEYRGRIIALLTEPQRALLRQRLDAAAPESRDRAAPGGRAAPSDRPRRDGGQSERRRRAPEGERQPPTRRGSPPAE